MKDHVISKESKNYISDLLEQVMKKKYQKMLVFHAS
jgi:hypothetical protein